ncbi:MAG: hypothetical protein B6241_13495 [Spirochaetaceae bacterium 4572_59]|nr:MAG: hypothetical protein B6241_13495 [Spirochaetaceae bacterium 4572_59]
MGIAERKQREKERRIREILESARDLFLSKGCDNTTMLDIAEKSELSRRTLYHYFESKEEISYIIMLEAYKTLKEMVGQAENLSTMNGIERLNAYQEIFFNFYHDHFDQFAFTLFLDQKIGFIERPNEEARKCLSIMDNVISVIKNTLDMGVEDGSIIYISNTKEAAVTMLTMILSTMQKIYIRKDWIKESFDVDDDQIIRTMFSMFMSAIRP